MVKSQKIIKQGKTSVLEIGRAFYVRIPQEFVKDSSFPLVILKNIVGKLKKGVVVRLKMLKDKLIIEEE